MAPFSIILVGEFCVTIYNKGSHIWLPLFLCCIISIMSFQTICTNNC